MIGCKLIRTLANVEIEIVLILGLSCCLSSSSVRCLDSDVYPVFVDLESSTQAKGAQSSQVPMPLPRDPYEAIRQAYLDGTDTESEPFEDPIDTKTHESPLAIAPPVLLSESTPPILVPILHMTARIAVRVPHAMSSGLYASVAEVAAMSKSTLRKRSRSSCESSPSVSLLDLPLRKHYRGTSELVEDSEEEEAVPRSQQQAALVMGTIDSGSAPESERPERVSAFRQPTLTTWTDPKEVEIQGGLIRDHAVRLEELSPALFERYDKDIGELFIRSGVGENQDLRLQLAKERRARLELTEVVDGMRIGQEPRGARFCPCVSALLLVARDREDTHILIRMWMSTVYVDMEIPPRMTEIRGSECLWKNGWLLFSGVQRSCIGGVGLLACVRHLCSHQDTSFKGRYDRGRRGEGPTAEDDGTAARMRVFQRRVEGPLWIDEGYGLMYLGGQQQAAPVVGTTVSAPLGLGYRALRCRELALEEGDVYSTFEVGQGSRLAPESERP
ncbi:hypothetical protein Tco_1570026 [Tanacetum coccineum]